jgi:DNA adenine methylase
MPISEVLNDSVSRPLLRYHGGKWLLADWIISFFPPHRVYVESYGGAASVLLKKARSYAEVYNDLDCEVVNLFKVCRQYPDELIHAVTLTPYARDEFEVSYLDDPDPIEKARRTIIRSFMGFGSGIQSAQRTGFRSNSNRSGTTPAQDWVNYPESLQLIIKRLRGVVIENRNAIEVMLQHDSTDTLHYIDPPYKKDTRYKGQKTKVYKHELEDSDHSELLGVCMSLNGSVIISGYDDDYYNSVLDGWHKVTRESFADGARPRIECLWMKLNHKSQLKLAI